MPESRHHLPLFSADEPTESASEPAVTRGPFAGESVSDLQELIDAGIRFPTIYADPPWAYANRSARGAAANHYQVLPFDELAELPVETLAERRAHLHLWATSSFLGEALSLIEAWGFRYRSSFVWVKDKIGCGNYWRLAHEFLLLGVRGNLPFRERSQRSWVLATRYRHSHKPAIVRSTIERVSPGPYLELFGREQIPDSDWTVFGNQVERRLF